MLRTDLMMSMNRFSGHSRSNGIVRDRQRAVNALFFGIIAELLFYNDCSIQNQVSLFSAEIGQICRTGFLICTFYLNKYLNVIMVVFHDK